MDGGAVGVPREVRKCDSKRCMMSRHLVEGDRFVSNTMNRSFHVLGSDAAMTCTTCNIVYLICVRGAVFNTSVRQINQFIVDLTIIEH